MDILLMVEGVVSSFGSSATSSLSLEHDEIETSSVVSDVFLFQFLVLNCRIPK